MKTDVKAAAIAAKQYLISLWETMGNLDIQDLRVEEVELSEDDQSWLITLGFTRPADRLEDPLGEVLETSRYRREYKIFKVDAETSQVKSMKIRQV
ncbi:MAG: hypothetical protein P5702_13995 [Limnospira sp. PMC 1291.21]|jgi:hypothetical protein|uniref:Uncharacterized protein n=2 Tax=Limnospira TaxID=2596745 RepID=B5W5E7_LIMMA|nr:MULTISPECIES: hypothetical protein [Oscillatoriales]EKD09640.1 hypothetical protein SPLC1_S170890 [Arthrospira platensis C1]MDC0836081.1 hypothetical protein [Limnoraphis robusta]MDY7054123.1 hypothetical protein [Limnospira fusiformis LS22]QJB28969.1 hypothetical protein HFV01_28215 [Limnospira fusiformis SAG 85.79]EDZ93214.1 conserved hypothetical protein [Limnospira maxima CS-328]